MLSHLTKKGSPCNSSVQRLICYCLYHFLRKSTDCKYTSIVTCKFAFSGSVNWLQHCFCLSEKSYVWWQTVSGPCTYESHAQFLTCICLSWSPKIKTEHKLYRRITSSFLFFLFLSYLCTIIQVKKKLRNSENVPRMYRVACLYVHTWSHPSAKRTRNTVLKECTKVNFMVHFVSFGHCIYSNIALPSFSVNSLPKSLGL